MVSFLVTQAKILESYCTAYPHHALPSLISFCNLISYSSLTSDFEFELPDFGTGSCAIRLASMDGLSNFLATATRRTPGSSPACSFVDLGIGFFFCAPHTCVYGSLSQRVSLGCRGAVAEYVLSKLSHAKIPVQVYVVEQADELSVDASRFVTEAQTLAATSLHVFPAL